MVEDSGPQKAKTLKSTEIPIVDDMTAPNIMVGGLRGMMDHDGFTTMNLTHTVYRVPGSENEGPVETVAVRLSMPTAAFARIVDVFMEHRDRLIKDGKLVVKGNEN